MNSKAFIIILLCTLVSVSYAKTLPLIEIDQLSTPHPKYCMAQAQWQDPFNKHPYLMLDGRKDTSWVPCSYALEDPGYSLEIRFKNKIQINGIRVVQGHNRPKKKRAKKKRAKQNTDQNQFAPHKELVKIQILYFNRSISSKYPVYFQNILFDGEAEVSVLYNGILKWNHILTKDSSFDVNRMAAKLPADGMEAPIDIDGIGVVFWEMKAGEEPPALSEISLLLDQKAYRFKNIKAKVQEHVQWLNKAYQSTMGKYVWVGDQYSLIFANSGSIWKLKEGEEIPTIIGSWKSMQGRIMVDVHKAHTHRHIAKKRRTIDRRRTRHYQPLAMLIDEVPDQLVIGHEHIGGDYEVLNLMKATSAIADTEDEYPPSFETP